MYAEFAQYLPEIMSMFGSSGSGGQGGIGSLLSGMFNKSGASGGQSGIGSLLSGMFNKGGSSGINNPSAQATINATHGLGAENPMTSSGGSGAGGAASDLYSLFTESPYSKYAHGLGRISPQLQQYLQRALGYMQPFRDTGVSAMGDYYSKLKQMEDPTKFYKGIMGTYQTSPAYKFRMDQGLDALKNTSAATGYSGSGHELKNILNFSQGLASQGQQQYLKNILGINTQAISGLGNLTGIGEQASNQMGAWTQQTGSEIANLMSQIAAAKANAASSRQSSIGSLIGNAASLF